ncbi:hypothetical protein [Bradyrhizobium sp. Rc2d]|uniref:hypothetical protein n=1 Tax=Bradyrhizobium sp. Rc2d TaxID=1855321 RepID=UPI001FCD73EA|nr:hypothetical protein [Bradyrhizobium sp. Rc2d]
MNSNPIGNFPARALITKVQLYVFNQGAFGPGSKVVVKGKEQDVICTFEAKDSVQHSYFLDDRVGYLVDGPSGLITATTQLSPAAISGADPWGVLLIDFVG